MASGRSPWREPMVWLIIALPAASVVATIALAIAAGGPGSTDNVADPVQRTGQFQTVDLGPDARAQQRKLSAIVRSSGDLVEVLPVGGTFEHSPMRLSLHHPARADLDRSLLLVPAGLGWRASARVDLSHDWNVQLTGTGDRWRLQGRWPASQHAAYLRPTLGQ